MLSLLESRLKMGEAVGRTGEWKHAGNLSGVVGDEGGKKRRCFFILGGDEKLRVELVGRLHGDKGGVACTRLT